MIEQEVIEEENDMQLNQEQFSAFLGPHQYMLDNTIIDDSVHLDGSAMGLKSIIEGGEDSSLEKHDKHCSWRKTQYGRNSSDPLKISKSSQSGK